MTPRTILEQEQPLPSRQAADAVHRQQRARDRPADDAGGERCRHERGNRPGTFARGKPLRQIENDAGKKARLGGAEQKAHDEETGRPLYQHQAGRYQPPRDHDAHDPEPRADARHHDVAGDL